MLGFGSLLTDWLSQVADWEKGGGEEEEGGVADPTQLDPALLRNFNRVCR